MGGLFCKPIIEDTILTRILTKALDQLQEQLVTTNELLQVAKKNSQKSTQTIQLANSSIMFQYKKMEQQNQGPLQSSIVLIPKAQRLRAKCIIAYEKAYFIGSVIKRNGRPFQFQRGNLYLLRNQLKQFQIKHGRWQNGILSYCQFNRITYENETQSSHNICKINSVKPGRTIRIEFDPSQMIAVEKYQGQFSISMLSNMSQVINGRGKIYFKNGDTYQGQIEQGRMHTSQDNTATYIQTKRLNEKEIISEWKGSFKDNLMDGQFTVIQKDNIQSVQFIVQMNHGVMNKNTIQFIERGLRVSNFRSRIIQ